MTPLPSCSDYSTSIVVGNLVKAPQLSGGFPELYRGNPVKYTGGFCIVFPYIANGKKFAVRCWHADIEGAKDRTKIISEALKRLKLPYFVGFEYVDEGIVTPLGIQPVVVMDWVDAKPLKAYIEENLYDADKLKELAASFAQMTNDLHKHGVSHGDLQHGNILVKPNGNIVLVDYDSMYVPELAGWTDVISGLQGYQHPARWENTYLSRKADFFSEMIIYTSIVALAELPQLWKDLKMSDSETLLFNENDIKKRGQSPIFEVVESLEGCADLIEQIKEALQCTSIDEIEPLETNRTPVADELRKLWNDNGYKPIPSYERKDVVLIANKW